MQLTEICGSCMRKYMQVRKINNKIEISFRYNPILISLVKSLDGRAYIPATKTWSIPLANSMPALELLASRGFEIEPSLVAEVLQDKREAEEIQALAELPDTGFDTPLPLFPYQKVGASFLYKIGSGILGDDCGLGKSVQALAVCVKVEAKKILIFTPSAVKWQWEQEVKKFIPDA